jgi:hypothetical protein
VEGSASSAVSLCCADCIGDEHLRRTVFEILGAGSGQCAYCARIGGPLLAPSLLRDAFEALQASYRQTGSGVPLLTVIETDWGLFGRERCPNAEELLEEILGAKPAFVEVAESTSDAITSAVRWTEFRSELLFRNRFFPRNMPDLEGVKELLPFLLQTENGLPMEWFRARIQEDREPFPIDRMLAPPPGSAGGGRANPPGIPYLYLGSSERAALAEVRPSRGDMVSVARCKLGEGLRVVDLRNPTRKVSPFALADAELIVRYRAELPFLGLLGSELSRPIRPRDAHIEYIPSQYLCEFIKSCGYDGVVYPTAAAEGMNIALFDPAHAHAIDVTSFRITSVLVESERT